MLKKLFKTGVTAAAGWVGNAIGGSTGRNIATKAVGSLFSKDPEVLNEFYKVFWIVLVMQPLCALAFIFDGVFKGLGKMKVLRNVLLLSTFLVFLPLLFWLDSLDLKLKGIFIAFTFWIIARGFSLIINFRKQFLPLAQKD